MYNSNIIGLTYDGEYIYADVSKILSKANVVQRAITHDVERDMYILKFACPKCEKNLTIGLQDGAIKEV